MSYDFNADEIFAMAEQIERNGAAFYKSASLNIDSPDSKKLLQELGKMEDGHEKVFSAIRANLSDKDKTSTVFDPDCEAAQYLKALAESGVSFKNTSPNVKDLKEILKYAIGTEKESIIFYLGMKELVPESLGKSRIDSIIKEEMGHIRLLSKELSKI